MNYETLLLLREKLFEIAEKQFTPITVTAEVAEPEYGWLPMTLTTSDGQKLLIEMSDVYNPLEDIRQMLNGWIRLDGIMKIIIDCETYKATMGMTPLTSISDSEFEYSLGLLVCHDSIVYPEAEIEAIVGVVDIKQVVKAIYTALKNRILSSQALLEDTVNWDDQSLVDYSDDPLIYRKKIFETCIYSRLLDSL